MTTLETDVEFMEVEKVDGLLAVVLLVSMSCDCCWISWMGRESFCSGIGSS